MAPARLIAALTLLSRILGVVRETVYGYFFGVAAPLSAFRIAFQIPNLARRLFGEGALSAAFIPVFSDCLHQRGREEARRLAGAVLTLLAAGLFGLTALGEIGLGAAHFFHPALSLRLTALMLPYMPLICMVAFLGGLLNVLSRFGVPAFTPVLFNLFLIAGTVLAGWFREGDAAGILYLVSGVVLVGGIAQFGLQAWALRRADFWPRLNLGWRDPEVRRIVRVMGPMVLGMSAVQINTLADSLIAWFCIPGGRGPAVLGYAQYLYQLPLGVFATALGTAIFPLLSARAAAGDTPGVTRATEQGLRMCLFIAIPASVGLCLIGRPLVSALFEWGEFNAEATRRVAWTLFFYATGVWAYSATQILVRALYALKDHRSPVRVATIMVGINLATNLVLVLLMDEAGIALGTASCAAVQALWLARKLHARLPEVRWGWVSSGAARMTLASAAMAGAVWLTQQAFGAERWTGLRPSIQVALSIAAATAAYAGAVWALRVEELAEVLRFRKRAPLARAAITD